MGPVEIVERHELYEVGQAKMVGNHPDRRMALCIDHGGEVHLNILGPGARAGNHYHQKVIEYFINTAPYPLQLHLRSVHAQETIVIAMPPPSPSAVWMYRPLHDVTHIVENAGSETVALAIVVDKDSPDDVFACPVYP